MQKAYGKLTTLHFKKLKKMNMKYFKLIAPAVFFFLGMAGLGAQTVEWLTDTHHDFETMKQYKPETFDFQFKNTTDAPLIIDNVRTTCGCTAPDWDETPVEPGAVGTIKIEYDAKRIGYFEKKVKVYFHGRRKPEALSIEGEVVE